LNDEVGALRSRLAVLDASPVPYTDEELALLKTAIPATANPDAEKKSISEMPAGTAELVASAQQHFAAQEFDAAEADYLKILDRDQNNGIALANLATIELQQGKLDDAEKHITAALAQTPDDAYNLSTLGYLKFRQEKYDDALKALSRAEQIDPNNPEIENYLGVTLSHQGQRKAAETALRRAIQLNPNYAPAHNNLAVIYLSQTPPLPQLARWHYQKALDAGQPRNPDLEKMLADQGAPVAAP
jgi:Flp pilus assembly protein TadD